MKNQRKNVIKKVIEDVIFIEFCFYLLIIMLSYSNGNDGLSTEKWVAIVIFSILAVPVIVGLYRDVYKDKKN